MTFTIFPHLPFHPDAKPNPYIQDFIATLNKRQNTVVVNPSHKNPLLSLFLCRQWGDIFVFNWFESIPDFKYGRLQAFIAILLIFILRLRRKKIVWVLHNKRPHDAKHLWLKKRLTRFIAYRADLILTHAQDGVDLVRTIFPSAAHKVHFINHPTKNRLPQASLSLPVIYDLLIWGHISKYKGIFEFAEFVKQHPTQMGHLRICIVGDCTQEKVFNTLQSLVPSNITCIRHSPTFEELGRYIRQSHFVLVPYQPESILSSGILMDSLSFGAKVIGPHTGSFKDYEHENKLNVHTFTSFKEIPKIISNEKDTQVNLEQYARFLEENNWEHFADKLIGLLQEINH